MTGANGGIGSEVVRHLAEDHDVLAIVGRKSAQELIDATWIVQADLATPDGVAVALGSIPRSRSVKVAVLCAGAIATEGGIDSEDVDQWPSMMYLNALGAVSLAKALVPMMSSSDSTSSSIIAVGSIYGSFASPFVIGYAMSKAALRQGVLSLAGPAAQTGVRINVVSPGNIDTSMTRAAGSDYLTDVVARTPSRRLGRVSEVVDCVRFLLGNEFVVGAEIVVDGGISLVGG